MCHIPLPADEYRTRCAQLRTGCASRCQQLWGLILLPSYAPHIQPLCDYPAKSSIEFVPDASRPRTSNSLNSFENCYTIQFYCNCNCNLAPSRAAIQAPTQYYAATLYCVFKITCQFNCIATVTVTLRHRAQPSKPRLHVTLQVFKFLKKILPNQILLYCNCNLGPPRAAIQAPTTFYSPPL